MDAIEPGEAVNLEDLPMRDGVAVCPVCAAILDWCWRTAECTECDWWAYC